MNGNDIRHWLISEMTNHGISEAELTSLSGLSSEQVRACLQGDAPCISDDVLRLLGALDLELVVRPRATPSERRLPGTDSEGPSSDSLETGKKV